MTLDLCNGIIVPEAAAMLDDTELEIIDAAHEVKSRRKIFLKKYRGTGSGIKKVPLYFSTRYSPPLGYG